MEVGWVSQLDLTLVALVIEHVDCRLAVMAVVPRVTL